MALIRSYHQRADPQFRSRVYCCARRQETIDLWQVPLRRSRYQDCQVIHALGADLLSSGGYQRVHHTRVYGKAMPIGFDQRTASQASAHGGAAGQQSAEHI